MLSLRQRLARTLELSAVDKSILITCILMLVLLSYQLLRLYTMNMPDWERVVHLEAMQELQRLHIALFTGALLIIGTALLLRRRNPDALWLQHITVQYYSLSLVISSYYIGTMTFCTGVVLLGAPVFGLILLDRRVVWGATLVSTLALLSLSYATSYGVLPYAPAVVPPTDDFTNRWWMTVVFLFTAPHFIIILLFSDQMVSFWRQREDTIRLMSLTDALTGIPNRRSIMETLDKEVARTRRHGPPMCVALLDLDHFKKVNDTHGHPTGDKVLQEAARVLREAIRSCDSIGRYGGEEFMIVMPDTTTEGAAVLLERCRAALAATIIRAETGKTFHISASFGVICNQKDMCCEAEALIKAADDALYRAKESGRNRVELAELPELAGLA